MLILPVEGSSDSTEQTTDRLERLEPHRQVDRLKLTKNECPVRVHCSISIPWVLET